jgi:hypothetical protein
MRRRILAMFIGGALAVAGARTSAAAGTADVVELRMRARYLSEPATLRMTVVVEPDAANRRLQVELDGDLLFRSSELPLDGAEHQRFNDFQFRGLPAGRYTLRVTVFSANAVRGTASEKLEVIESLRR